VIQLNEKETTRLNKKGEPCNDTLNDDEEANQRVKSFQECHNFCGNNVCAKNVKANNVLEKGWPMQGNFWSFEMVSADFSSCPDKKCLYKLACN
jgi:hypothetical protein